MLSRTSTIDHVRAGKRARKRGSNGELEVRDLIRSYGWETAHRQWLSGGDGGGDLADAVPDVHFEVKYVEKLHLPAAWRQALSASRPTDMVVVVHRANFQPWVASLRLTDLFSWRDPGWKVLVIGRSGLRAEFMALSKRCTHPLVVHPCAGEALGSVLFEDLLRLLANERDEQKEAV